MMGVYYAVAVGIGLIAGIIPGVIGIIVMIRASVKRKQPALVLYYLGLTAAFEVLLFFLCSRIFECGGALSGTDEMTDCFKMYIFLAASPGCSLLLGLSALFFKGKKT